MVIAGCRKGGSGDRPAGQSMLPHPAQFDGQDLGVLSGFVPGSTTYSQAVDRLPALYQGWGLTREGVERFETSDCTLPPALREIQARRDNKSIDINESNNGMGAGHLHLTSLSLCFAKLPGRDEPVLISLSVFSGNAILPRLKRLRDLPQPQGCGPVAWDDPTFCRGDLLGQRLMYFSANEFGSRVQAVLDIR